MAENDVAFASAKYVGAIDKRRFASYRTLLGVIRAFAKSVEKVEPHTAGHQIETARFAVRMAKRLRFQNAAIRLIHLGATLHDIGKIGVPPSILLRPGKLSPNEFALVKEHPQIGWEIMSEVEFTMPIAAVIQLHHERLDGSGYPFGLVNGSIMNEALVVAVADTTQAMLSYRAYRPRLDTKRIVEILEEDRGVRLPARYVDVAIDLLSADAT
jgi:HD-GYP domain-containing protein (c-di-GMP phosphodiesterase class II)